MSVRKGDRGEGKLQVLNKARELKKIHPRADKIGETFSEVYTVDICLPDSKRNTGGVRMYSARKLRICNK